MGESESKQSYFKLFAIVTFLISYLGVLVRFDSKFLMFISFPLFDIVS